MSWWSENIAPLAQDPTVAGVVGSIASLKWIPGETYAAKFFSFFIGAAVAVFGTKAMVSGFAIKSEGWPLFLAFLLGFIGVNLLGKLWDFVSKTSIPDLISMIRGNKS